MILILALNFYFIHNRSVCGISFHEDGSLATSCGLFRAGRSILTFEGHVKTVSQLTARTTVCMFDLHCPLVLKMVCKLCLITVLLYLCRLSISAFLLMAKHLPLAPQITYAEPVIPTHCPFISQVTFEPRKGISCQLLTPRYIHIYLSICVHLKFIHYIILLT